MLLSLIRETVSMKCTFGVLLVDGKKACYTLEDEPRKEKVYSETCIPPARYKVSPREYGSHYEKYKKRFPDYHEGMMWLQNVKGFEDILIHCGNSRNDTAGCILVGNGKSEKEGILTLSTAAYEYLYTMCHKALYDGTLEIEISELDAVKRHRQ